MIVVNVRLFVWGFFFFFGYIFVFFLTTLELFELFLNCVLAQPVADQVFF